MRAVYRVHPHPDASSLLDLIKNAAIDPNAYRSLLDLSVKHVDVDPEDQTWQIHVTGECDDEDPQRIEQALGQLERDLAQGIADVSKVRLIPEFLRPAPVAAAIQPEASPDDGVDDYMAMIFERAREWSKLQEEEERAQRTDTKGDDVVLMGRRITEEPVPLKDVQDEERKVIIQGQVIALDVREMRSGRKLLTFDVTDLTDSISVKVWESEESQSLSKSLAVGDWVRLRGGTQFDTYSNELTMIPRDCIKVPPPPARIDDAEEKRGRASLAYQDERLGRRRRGRRPDQTGRFVGAPRRGDHRPRCGPGLSGGLRRRLQSRDQIDLRRRRVPSRFAVER